MRQLSLLSWVWIGCFLQVNVTGRGAFAALPSEAKSKLARGPSRPEKMTSAEASKLLGFVIDTVKRRDGTLKKSYRYLEAARGHFARENPKFGVWALDRMRTEISKDFKPRPHDADAKMARAFTRYMAYRMPDHTRQRIGETLVGLEALLSETKSWEARERKNRGWIAVNASPRRNEMIDRSYVAVANQLADLRGWLKHAPSAWLEAFMNRKYVLFSRIEGFQAALMSRYSTLDDRALEFGQMIQAFKETRKFGYDARMTGEIYENELREEHLRIWVNQKTLTALAFAAACVAGVVLFAAFAPVIAGGVLAGTSMGMAFGAVSAGSAAVWGSVLTGLTIVGGALTIATATGRILDRWTAGTLGDRKWETFFDVLMIVCSFVPIVKPLFSGTKLAHAIAVSETVANQTFNVTRSGYKMWEFINADWLPERYGEDKDEIQADSVRSIANYIIWMVGGLVPRR